MRCAGLLERPWALKREELVREIVQPERPNIFNRTIRNWPQLWTADLWQDTYSFPRGGSRLSNRMEGYHEGRFLHQVDPKDGYSVGDCRNNRQRRLLEFLVPIVHPDKPTRVTITIGNTIFGALDEGREVDWGVVFRDMAHQLAKGVGKPKPTPICPFLFHLYEGQGLLTPDEELDYRTAKEMAGYRIIPDHPRSGFTAQNQRRRGGFYPSTLASTGAFFADTQPEEEVNIQGTNRVASGPIKGTFEPGSTGTIAKGSTTCP